MSDIFTITVPVPRGTYPSVNNLGADSRRGGRKTEQYHELGQSVLHAATAEMQRSGWETATYYVSGSITRYVRTAIVSDPSNLGKCEMDFLEKAGVVANDTLIRPIQKDIQYDPNGSDRIVIVLQRLYPRISDAPTQKPKKAHKPVSVESPTPATKYPKRPKLAVAMINGKTVSYGEALRAAGLTEDFTDRRKRA